MTKIEAKVNRQMGITAERVYDAWLDPSQVWQWMATALRDFGLAGEMRQVEIDPRVAGKFAFSDMRGENEARHWGTYLALERPRKISFTWITSPSEEDDPSIVEIVIESQGEGCRVSLVHRMAAKWADYVERVESGWSRMLAAIESANSA
jgi:uncharacterized protein YndB with AHSA1/START domain